MSEDEYAEADAWLERAGLAAVIDQTARRVSRPAGPRAEAALDTVADRFLEAWQAEAGLKTLRRGRRRGDGLPRRRGRPARR